MSSALTVNYTLSGTAQNGADYELAGTSVTIPAGAGSTVLTVVAVEGRHFTRHADGHRQRGDHQQQEPDDLGHSAASCAERRLHGEYATGNRAAGRDIHGSLRGQPGFLGLEFWRRFAAQFGAKSDAHLHWRRCCDRRQLSVEVTLTLHEMEHVPSSVPSPRALR